MYSYSSYKEPKQYETKCFSFGLLANHYCFQVFTRHVKTQQPSNADIGTCSTMLTMTLTCTLFLRSGRRPA